MKPTESDIHTALQRLFMKDNVRDNNQGQFSRKGTLDKTVFINGVAHNVEVKIDNDSLSKTQKDFIRRGWRNSYALHFYSESKTFDIYYYGYCYHMSLYKDVLMVGKELYSFNDFVEIV